MIALPSQAELFQLLALFLLALPTTALVPVLLEAWFKVRVDRKLCGCFPVLWFFPLYGYVKKYYTTGDYVPTWAVNWFGVAPRPSKKVGDTSQRGR